MTYLAQINIVACVMYPKAAQRNRTTAYWLHPFDFQMICCEFVGARIYWAQPSTRETKFFGTGEI